MLPFPHIRIANHVRRVLETRYSYKVAPIPFALGSIYPDFTYKTFQYKHNISDVMREAWVFRKIASRVSAFRRSFQLGVVCHYTADSFCDAHISPEKYNKLQHLNYEIRQAKFIRRRVSRAEKLAMSAKDSPTQKSFESFLAHYRDFLSRRHSYNEECEAAVEGSVALLRGLITSPPVTNPV